MDNFLTATDKLEATLKQSLFLLSQARKDVSLDQRVVSILTTKLEEVELWLSKLEIAKGE